MTEPLRWKRSPLPVWRLSHRWRQALLLSSGLFATSAHAQVEQVAPKPLQAPGNAVASDAQAADPEAQTAASAPTQTQTDNARSPASAQTPTFARTPAAEQPQETNATRLVTPAIPGMEVRVTYGAQPASNVSSASASAQVEQPAASSGRLSLGVGIGFGGFGDVGPGGLGALGGLYGTQQPISRAPVGVALLELTLSPNWRLTAGLSGSYTRQVSGAYDVSNNVDKAWSTGASIGARHVLNPGGVVEVSPILLVGGYTALTHGVVQTGPVVDGEPELAAREQQQRGLEARLGLVLEYALLPNLFLRVDTYFVRALYAKSTAIEIIPGVAKEETQRKDVSVGYGLSPVLSLRLSF